MSVLPRSRPQAGHAIVMERAEAKWRDEHPNEPFPEVSVVAVPGYYWRTMGDPTANDRNIYDDAFFVVSRNTFTSFNGNCDPSVFRKGVATLMPGCYPYRRGNHGVSRPGGGYPAFRPATKNEELPVRRDGDPNVPSKRPGVAINNHRGGYNTTSSLGCLTVPPHQWGTYYALVDCEMKRAKVSVFWMIVLDEGPIN